MEVRSALQACPPDRVQPAAGSGAAAMLPLLCCSRLSACLLHPPALPPPLPAPPLHAGRSCQRCKRDRFCWWMETRCSTGRCAQRVLHYVACCTVKTSTTGRCAQWLLHYVACCHVKTSTTGRCAQRTGVAPRAQAGVAWCCAQACRLPRLLPTGACCRDHPARLAVPLRFDSHAPPSPPPPLLQCPLLVDCLEFLVGQLHGRPNLVPADFPFERL